MNGDTAAVESPLLTPEKILSITAGGRLEVTIASTKAIEIMLPVNATSMRTPDATPRWRTGTEAMIELEFGGLKRPPPMPTTDIHTARRRYGGLPLTATAIPAKPTAVMTSPSVLGVREPIRSLTQPASGDTTSIDKAKGVTARPA